MERFTSRTKVLIGLGLVFAILVTGILGYMLIEGDNFLNALYMTVITISTVGFGEIHRLSPGGKVFTMFLIISSFTTYAYALTTLSVYFFEGQLSVFLKGYRTKSIRKMQNHVIICGYGRNGQQTARELMAHNYPMIVIDQNHEVVMKAMNKNASYIEGDATLDDILLKANIKTARALITTLPVDADNLYVVLSARALNPGMVIISRASNESSEVKLRMAGVDNVVMPERVGGTHMANLVVRPDIVEFLEHVSIHSEDPTLLEEIVCDTLPEQTLNKSINEIGIRRVTGTNIIGYKTADGRYILNPKPETKLFAGSKLFVLGTSEQIEKMKEILNSGN